MTERIKVLIVDDEPAARAKIRSFLSRQSGVKRIVEAKDGVEAIEAIKQGKPDVVFLDIQMPEVSGFDVIEYIGSEAMPSVIFVTAYDQYAIQAFEVNAIDYLLKPFDLDRFNKAFDRAVHQIGSNLTPMFEKLLEQFEKDREKTERILVNRGDKYFFVRLDEISYISSNEKYAQIHSTRGKYLVRETMNNLEKELDPAKFLRIHRSYIINVDRVCEIQKWSHGDFVVILSDGTKLTGSRKYKHRLFSGQS